MIMGLFQTLAGFVALLRAKRQRNAEPGRRSVQPPVGKVALGEQRDPFKEAREDRRKDECAAEALGRLFWSEPARASKRGQWIECREGWVKPPHPLMAAMCTTPGCPYMEVPCSEDPELRAPVDRHGPSELSYAGRTKPGLLLHCLPASAWRASQMRISSS